MGSGKQDVTRHIQPQKSQTQETSWDPRAAGSVGDDPGGAFDAGTRALGSRTLALSRSPPASDSGIRQTSPSTASRHPAPGDLVGRSPAEDQPPISGRRPEASAAAAIFCAPACRSNCPGSAACSTIGGKRRSKCRNARRLNKSCRRRSQRPCSYFIKKAMQETRGFVFSDYPGRPGRAGKLTVIAAYPVAAVDNDEDAFVVAAVNLDWMSLVMGNLGGRPGVSAVLIDSVGHRYRAGTTRSGRQHDRPSPRQRAAAFRHRRACESSVRTEENKRLDFIYRSRRLQARGLIRAHARHQCAPSRLHRRNQGLREHQPRHSARRPTCNWPSSAFSC